MRADEANARIDPAGRGDEEEAPEVDLGGDDEGGDLDAAMREAVAAVEELESRGGEEAEGERREAAGDADEAELLRREIDELRDRSVRTLADFDNFRKRSERERSDLRRYALVEPMREMIAVVDNLERALGAEGSADDLKTGVEMILRQMQDLLRRQGVREVVAVGAPFDPTVHEAVARREEPGLTEPVVVRELQPGYQLHDRLLRPAMVEVAVPADDGAGRDDA
jgi:molecular chaperone GrpE